MNRFPLLCGRLGRQCLVLFFLFSTGLLSGAIVSWDVSARNLITPGSYGNETNQGNTAIGVWFNMANGEAYVVEGTAGIEGKTNLADGRFQLRYTTYWDPPSSDVLVQGTLGFNALLGTTTAVPGAAAGSPRRLAEGDTVPTGASFRVASYAEMAGTFGVWKDLGRGFLGVRFPRATAAGGTALHFGFADITILADGSIKLNGFAYEDTPNTAITTFYIGAGAPEPASELTVTSVTSTTISLGWKDNSENETAFLVQRRGPGEQAFTTIATTAPNVTSHTDLDLPISTAYSYRVIATSGIDAAPSNEVSATTLAVENPPNPPGNVSAGAASPTTMRVSWSDQSDNETSFRIERKEIGGAYAEVGRTDVNVATFLDAGLLPGTPYQYRIVASNGLASAGVESGVVKTYSVRETVGADAVTAGYPAIDGSGVVVGLWDFAPALSTHVEFANERVTNREGGEAGSDAQSNHTTHGAGVIVASGVDPSAKGIAPGAKVDVYLFDNDLNEFKTHGMQSSGQTGRLQIGNASYGPLRGWEPTGFDNAPWRFVPAESGGVPQNADPAFGVYSSYSAEVDAALWETPYFLLVRSAGNDRDDGPEPGDFVFLSAEDWGANATTVYNPDLHAPKDGGTEGYSIISDAAAAKNTLTVGAIAGASRDAGGVLLAVTEETTFSNWGPTRDGRIKPDVVAAGVDVRSAGYASNNAYTTLTGSSQAAPEAAGVAALVLQEWKTMNPASDPRASTLKALLIHTADDLSTPGPDPRTGWGLVNARAAIDLIAESSRPGGSAAVTESSLTSTTPRGYLIFRNGNAPLKLTLCWTDPGAAAGDSTPLVNDLDLVVTDSAGTRSLPFVLSENDTIRAENRVDPVEQVLIEAPGAMYFVSVGINGALSQSAQPYSFVVSGGTLAPAPVADLVEVDGKRFLHLTYTRRKDSPGNFILETSANLNTGWTALSNPVVLGTTDLGNGLEEVRVRDTTELTGATTHRFVRLRLVE